MLRETDETIFCVAKLMSENFVDERSPQRVFLFRKSTNSTLMLTFSPLFVTRPIKTARTLRARAASRGSPCCPLYRRTSLNETTCRLSGESRERL